jgi:hypothetical protein
MIKKQKRKRKKIEPLRCTIAAGMIHLATIFAAAMYAAAVRWYRGFSEMSSPQEVMAYIFLEWIPILNQCILKEVGGEKEERHDSKI